MIALTDHRTGAQVQVDPQNLGSLVWELCEDGERRPKFQIRREGQEAGYIIAADPPAMLAIQMMVFLPGSDAITFLSQDPLLGNLRKIVSLLIGSGWSRDRVAAATSMVLAEIPSRDVPGLNLPNLGAPTPSRVPRPR